MSNSKRLIMRVAAFLFAVFYVVLSIYGQVKGKYYQEAENATGGKFYAKSN